MTATGWTDLVLGLLLLAGAVAGWRRGGLRLAGAVLGLVAGLLVGWALVPALTSSLTGTTARVVTVAGTLVVGLLGAGVGRWAGSLPATLLARLHLGVLDRAAGAAGGLLLTLAVVGGALLLAGPGPHTPAPAADWVAAARGSQLGRAATSTAGYAAGLVGVTVPDDPAGRLARGPGSRPPAQDPAPR